MPLCASGAITAPLAVTGIRQVPDRDLHTQDDRKSRMLPLTGVNNLYFALQGLPSTISGRLGTGLWD